MEQSCVAMGKTHLILWAMAEEFIEQARSLCFVATTQPNSQPGWRKRHQNLVTSAIKCLTACVSGESQSMTQLDKAKSRLRLAQILFEETESLERCEDEISKAITMADAIQGVEALDIQLQLYDLQIQIYMETKRFRQAKNIIRMASAEAAKHELHAWKYQFCLTKAKLHFLMDDLAGSLTTLGEGATIAEKRGDYDVKLAFWILGGQYSLMLSNWDQAMFFLQKLSPHMGLEQIHIITPNSGNPPEEIPQPSCESRHLRVLFLILFIFCMLRSGNVAKALVALSALQVGLEETRPRDGDDLQGIFKVALRNAQQTSQQVQPMTLSIKWMSFSQVYTLTYLLSGICSKADMTNPAKSQQYLAEGIKVVNREFNVNDYASAAIYVRKNQQWFSLLMLNMLLHLADVYLLQFDHASAEETLLRATYWCKVCNVWDTFKWRISLSIGMLMHLGGKLDEALTWYGICMSHVESSHKDPEGYDTKSIALINAAIIYCGDRHFDLQRVKSIQMEVKSRYPSSTMTPNITCALHILDSWTVEGLMLARQHLLESLRLSAALQNTQMRSLTLLLLGNVYLQTHDDQAEKMLVTGYLHALKTKNQIVAAAAGSSLKDLYLKTSQGIRASQQAQQNKVVLDVVDQAFQSTLMAPLVALSKAEHDSTSSGTK
ncbi:MAG: cohesin loading factor [Podila humilis]|nr:MAG: cohesin loading factor [Podila humilis]